jgi:hypothetical protein
VTHPRRKAMTRPFAISSGQCAEASMTKAISICGPGALDDLFKRAAGRFAQAAA